ncbi:MAG TPA: phospho-N-acetylmuramoyl-pentapeptide-transferase, partial [Kofleriaceae bacterium]
MLFYLLYDILADLEGLGFLRVFRYLSTRILAAAITSLIISFLLGPWFIERMKRRQFGQQIRDDGPQTHK